MKTDFVTGVQLNLSMAEAQELFEFLHQSDTRGWTHVEWLYKDLLQYCEEPREQEHG